MLNRTIWCLLLAFSWLLNDVVAQKCGSRKSHGNGGICSGLAMFCNSGGTLYLGVYYGSSWRTISAIEGTLGASLSDPASYDFNEGPLRVDHLGITAIYGIEGTDAFIQFEGGYSAPFITEDPFDRAQGIYSDVEGLEYAINFPYQQVHLRTMVGAYLIPYISGKIGFDWGINTTPDRITYDSNDATIGRDLAIRDELRDKLIGKNDFGPLLGVGLNIPVGFFKDDFNWMIFFDGYYKIGLSDVIFTRSNNFRLQERQNRTQSFQINAGFRISI